MSTLTTNMSLSKAVDSDNTKTYLETSLGGSLDKVDAHDHSLADNSRGKQISAITGNLLLTGTLNINGNQTLSGTMLYNGTGIAATQVIQVNGVLTGGVSTYGIISSPAGQNATSEVAGFFSQPGVSSTGGINHNFSLMAGFHAGNPTGGALATIIGTAGVFVDPMTAGTQTNYGVQIAKPSGGSVDNQAIYITGVGTGSAFRIDNTQVLTVGAAGSASALPATPAEYLIVNLRGTNFKIALWNV